MRNPESRHGTRPASTPAENPIKTRRDDGGQVGSSRSAGTARHERSGKRSFRKFPAESRIPLCLSLAALACALCATAVAQQKPLTGRMLGNQPQPTDTAPPAPPQATPAQPAPPPPQTQPATTYPTQPVPGGQPVSSTPPPRAPMPAYTDMQTLGPQADLADADIEPRDAVFGTPIGGTTENLLQMQASNRSAGPARSMLGDEATAAYKRYIDSFNHPVPEFFQTNVESGSNSGSGM